MDTDKLPALLKELRGRLGLSQEKLASLLRVSVPTVNRWEKGKTTPDPLGVNAIEQFVAELGDRDADLYEQFFGSSTAELFRPAEWERPGSNPKCSDGAKLRRFDAVVTNPMCYVAAAAVAENRDIQTILDDLGGLQGEAKRLDGDLQGIFEGLGYRWGAEP